MYPVEHINLWYLVLAIVFTGIISYMFLYNRRSKDREKDISQHGHAIVSKEAGILEAQESMKQTRRWRHRHP